MREEERHGVKGVVLDLNHYLSDLITVPIPLDSAGWPVDPETPLTPELITRLRGQIGQLLWLALSMDMKLAFKVSAMAQRVPRATIGDLMEGNKLIQEAKDSPTTLFYPKMGKNISLKVFSDSSFGNLEDGGSQGGYFVCMEDEDTGLFAPLSWGSRKLRRVLRSTVAAVTEAMVDAIDEGVFWVWFRIGFTRGLRGR